MDAIPTIVGAALLTLAAASADAQQTKEMLTHDPNVLQSLEPNPTPQGNRSPDPIDPTDDENGFDEALDQIKDNPVTVQGREVERQTRPGGRPRPEESAGDVEQRARVPDADEPQDHAR